MYITLPPAHRCCYSYCLVLFPPSLALCIRLRAVALHHLPLCIRLRAVTCLITRLLPLMYRSFARLSVRSCSLLRRTPFRFPFHLYRSTDPPLLALSLPFRQAPLSFVPSAVRVACLVRRVPSLRRLACRLKVFGLTASPWACWPKCLLGWTLLWLA